MSLENRPIYFEPSPAESALAKLNIDLQLTQRFLMKVFFQNDTWSVRQSMHYGSPLLRIDGDLKYHDWQREVRLLADLYHRLGERCHYLGEAYHFPDTLSALAVQTSREMVIGKAMGLKKSLTDTSKEVLLYTQHHLIDETPKFVAFLESTYFRQAFTIRIDQDTGEYAISDLKLDPQQLFLCWKELIAFLG